MLRRFKLVALSLVVLLAALPARAQTTAGDSVIILPFENTSAQREHNWIGPSFADALSEFFRVPGLRVVSNDERELLYQRLRLPLTTLPSRATAIKIAREARASLVVIGNYTVKVSQDERVPAEISGSARVIDVNRGQQWQYQFDFGDALVNLQKLQGKLAWQILYQRDPAALTVSLNDVLEKANRVPPRAFESFVKGVMTEDPEKRSNYLQNAQKEYAKVHAGETYSDAAFELGNLHYRQGKWKDAAEHYSKLKRGDANYAEAAFYAGIAHWKQHDLKSALAALIPLTSAAPLTGVYNNAGAISLQAARDEKDAAERDRSLRQAVELLGRAKETEPDEATVLYNYAYALFLSGKFAEAADSLRKVLTVSPRDGEAFFLYSKALERAGQAEAAAAADNEARRYLKTYAALQTNWQKSQTVAEVAPRLVARFDVAEAISRREVAVEPVGPKAEDLLERARKLYAAGQDDEVLPELNRVLMIEPMNAEAHLYIGRVHMRRGDLERAIISLKNTLFWSNQKSVDAHVLLGRIFLEKGDRAQALVHARTAIQLDPNHQDALALHRQVETGAR
ncbi:MAG TPA: tetratricopeptide repeat protein [Pyrinomonadaceae bacterium]|nr:tetratricopeptide repeat protein [Pyrinomonadaceae bacterium]